MATSTDKKIELIAQLLAKAESTTPEEAQSLTEHAERLMAKYLIDQAVIDDRRSKQGTASEQIIQVRRDYKGNFAGEMFHIGQMVGVGMGTVKTMQATSKGYFHLYLVGFESDVQQAEVLINSLEIQAMMAVRAWWKASKADHSYLSSYDQEKARRGFVHGFGTGAGVRIRDNRAKIVEEAGTGTELVLVDRTAKVTERVAQLSRGKARSRGSVQGGNANTQGFIAGQQANTGEKSVGHTKQVGA